MIGINEFKKMMEQDGECLPLLTLDQFFLDNVEEESIAPNQWLYGRPSISDISSMLKELEKNDTIAWVRVSLHDDTEIEVNDMGEEVLFLSGDTVIICTSVNIEELKKMIDMEWLCSDGIISADMKDYFNVPDIPERHFCFEIVWD